MVVGSDGNVLTPNTTTHPWQARGPLALGLHVAIDVHSKLFNDDEPSFRTLLENQCYSFALQLRYLRASVIFRGFPF